MDAAPARARRLTAAPASLAAAPPSLLIAEPVDAGAGHAEARDGAEPGRPRIGRGALPRGGAAKSRRERPGDAGEELGVLVRPRDLLQHVLVGRIELRLLFLLLQAAGAEQHLCALEGGVLPRRAEIGRAEPGRLGEIGGVAVEVGVGLPRRQPLLLGELGLADRDAVRPDPARRLRE